MCKHRNAIDWIFSEINKVIGFWRQKRQCRTDTLLLKNKDGDVLMFFRLLIFCQAINFSLIKLTIVWSTHFLFATLITTTVRSTKHIVNSAQFTFLNKNIDQYLLCILYIVPINGTKERRSDIVVWETFALTIFQCKQK